MLRWLTAGESHGPLLVAIVEGLPAGVVVTTADIDARTGPPPAGLGRGARMKFERTRSGSWAASATAARMGGPVAIEVGNTEWPKWETVMSPTPWTPTTSPRLARNAPLTRPRPGHADLVGHAEVRLRRRPAGPGAGVSARETAARVALGAVAKAFLRAGGGVDGRQPRRGDRAVAVPPRTPRARLRTTWRAIDDDPVRCLDPATSAAMVAEIERGPQGRRHPRRRRRGGRVRAAAGPGQPRALGPPPRRPPRRCADGHPGDQGRRGRRRLRARPHAAARRRTTRSCPAATACAGPPGARRHRGRHVDRRACCGCARR